MNGLTGATEPESRLKELEGFIFTILKLVIEPIQKQAKGFRHIASQLEEKIIIDYSIEFITSLNVHDFKQISSQDLYKILVVRRAGKISDRTTKYHKLISRINYLRTIESSMYDIMNNFQPIFEQYQNEWNDSIKKIDSFFIEIRTQDAQTNFEQRRKDFLNDFDKVVSNWQNLPSIMLVPDMNIRDRYVLYDNLVIPLRNIARKYEGDDWAMNLMNIILDCVHYYEKIEHLKKFTSSSFSNLATKLADAFEEIKSFIEDNGDMIN